MRVPNQSCQILHTYLCDADESDEEADHTVEAYNISLPWSEVVWELISGSSNNSLDDTELE